MTCPTDTTPPAAPDTPLRFITSGGRGWGCLPAQRRLIRQGLSAALGHAAAAGAWWPGRPVVLSHGGCTGADTVAGQIATELGWNDDPWRIDWDAERARRPRTWRAAGPERNRAMCAARPRAWVALIFPGGGGTADCAAAAAEAGIRTVHYTPHPPAPAPTAHSVKVSAPDFPAALAFYTAGLALLLIDGPRTMPDGRAVALLDADGIQAELIEDRPGQPPSPVQLNLACEDGPAARRVLDQRGLRPVLGPFTPRTGRDDQTELTVYTDPAGTRIAIRSPAREDTTPSC